jgi:K+-transporting ATPase ATPase C chain
MLVQLRPAVVAVVLATLVLGLVYPLAVTGISQVAFPGAADGSLVTRDGAVVGSSLIGQSFQRAVLDDDGRPAVDDEGEPVTEPDPRYLQPRPSQTGYSGDATFFSPVSAASPVPGCSPCSTTTPTIARSGCWGARA